MLRDTRKLTALRHLSYSAGSYPIASARRVEPRCPMDFIELGVQKRTLIEIGQLRAGSS